VSISLDDVPPEARDAVKAAALDELRAMQAPALALAKRGIARFSSSPNASATVSALLERLQAATEQLALDPDSVQARDAVEDWQGAYDLAKATDQLSEWATDREAMMDVIDTAKDGLMSVAKTAGPHLLKLAMLAVL